MAAIHQRGRGQVMPLCRGGKTPIGTVYPWGDVTCVQCRLAPTVQLLVETASTIWDSYKKALKPLVDSLIDLARQVTATAAIDSPVDELWVER